MSDQLSPLPPDIEALLDAERNHVDGPNDEAAARVTRRVAATVGIGLHVPLVAASLVEGQALAEGGAQLAQGAAEAVGQAGATATTAAAAKTAAAAGTAASAGSVAAGTAATAGAAGATTAGSSLVASATGASLVGLVTKPLVVGAFVAGAVTGGGTVAVVQKAPVTIAESAEDDAPPKRVRAASSEVANPGSADPDSADLAARPKDAVDPALDTPEPTPETPAVADAERKPRTVRPKSTGGRKMRARRDRPAAAASGGTADTALGRERALLEIARTALARGHHATAIDTLQRHRESFPKGRMAEERDALHIVALAGKGAVISAKSRAKVFRRRFPQSLLLPAVEQALRNAQ